MGDDHSRKWHEPLILTRDRVVISDMCWGALNNYGNHLYPNVCKLFSCSPPLSVSMGPTGGGEGRSSLPENVYVYYVCMCMYVIINYINSLTVKSITVTFVMRDGFWATSALVGFPYSARNALG